ncbi:MAG: PQQ-dependent sugar dehydrogenase, partial [Planctomycetota bacterium]
GDLWIGDVGQEEREEINVADAGTLGVNFGWPVMEGETCHASPGCAAATPACGDTAFEPAAFEYAHDLGCSVTGGFVYRGTAIPDLQGHYLATDFCSRRFWTTERTATGFETSERSIELRPAGVSPISASSFGEDGHGELIVLDHGGGTLYRLVHGCEATTTCLGEENSLGQRSDLRFAGSTSVAANDVTVRLGTLPPLAPALLFVGPDTADVPVAGGRLCVGGSIIRVGVMFATAEGFAGFPMDWTEAPFQSGPSHVLPGSSLTFQAWYRQPILAAGDAGSNFTSATTVTFCP